MTRYRTHASCNLLLPVYCRQTVADFRIKERFTEDGFSHVTAQIGLQSRLVTQLVYGLPDFPLFSYTLSYNRDAVNEGRN